MDFGRRIYGECISDIYHMVNDNYPMANDNEMEYEICNDFVIKC